MSSTDSIIMFVACVPSAVVGLGVWFLQRRINKIESRREEREKAREKNEFFVVQRIPDARCNGDLTKALEYAEKVKHEHKDFLHEQAIHNLY